MMDKKLKWKKNTEDGKNTEKKRNQMEKNKIKDNIGGKRDEAVDEEKTMEEENNEMTK